MKRPTKASTELHTKVSSQVVEVHLSLFSPALFVGQLRRKWPTKLTNCNDEYSGISLRILRIFCALFPGKRRPPQIPPECPHLSKTQIPRQIRWKKKSQNFKGRSLQCGFVSHFSSRPWRNLPPIWVIHMATRRPGHNTLIHMDFLSLSRSHTRNPCGSACCGLVCVSPCGSPMWGQISPWPARKVTEFWLRSSQIPIRILPGRFLGGSFPPVFLQRKRQKYPPLIHPASRSENSPRIFAEDFSWKKSGKQSVLIFRGFPRFYGDFPVLSFSSLLVCWRNLQGHSRMGSATQSGPFRKRRGNPPYPPILRILQGYFLGLASEVDENLRGKK